MRYQLSWVARNAATFTTVAVGEDGRTATAVFRSMEKALVESNRLLKLAPTWRQCSIIATMPDGEEVTVSRWQAIDPPVTIEQVMEGFTAYADELATFLEGTNGRG